MQPLLELVQDDQQFVAGGQEITLPQQADRLGQRQLFVPLSAKPGKCLRSCRSRFTSVSSALALR